MEVESGEFPPRFLFTMIKATIMKILEKIRGKIRYHRDGVIDVFFNNEFFMKLRVVDKKKLVRKIILCMKILNNINVIRTFVTMIFI